MIITMKTLQQKTFKVEIDEEATVEVLKQKIEEQEGPAFPAANMKLIYSGKILNDPQLLKEYKIEEKNFVVVMISKVKVAAKPPEEKVPDSTPVSSSGATPTAGTRDEPMPQASTETTTQSTSTTESVDNGGTPATTVPGSTDELPTTTSSASEGNWQQASSVLVTGEDYEAAVKQLMEMGFTRDRVIEALRSSFNNPDRAAEYLYTSAGDSDDIPPLNEQFAPLPLQASSIVRGDFNPSGPSPPAPPVRINPSGSYPATVRPNPPPQPPTTSSSNTIDPLTMLSQMPQFQSIREQVQANPQLLQAFLQQLGQSNPMLLQLINSDPQRFVDLLNAPPTSAGTANEGDDDNEGQPPAGSVSIQVTPEDKEVIDRLKSMGFPEGLVVQAYFACDKNEELALNFLLSDDDN